MIDQGCYVIIQDCVIIIIMLLLPIPLASVPCSPSPSINSQTSEKSIFTSLHTPSTSMALFSSLLNNTTVVKSTLPSNNKHITVSSGYYYSVSSGIPKPTTIETNKTIATSPLLANKITLIVSVVIPTLFVSLITIVTFAVVILLRSGKKSGKRKQSERGECMSQQGITNQAYFEPGVLL